MIHEGSSIFHDLLLLFAVAVLICTQIRHKEPTMSEKVFIQVQSTVEEREMLAEIAASRHKTMSAQVREWIRDTYKRIKKAEAA